MADIYLPSELRALLKRHGKRQVDLANLLNVDPTAVSKMLTGKRVLKAHEAAAILDWIGPEPTVHARAATPIPIIGQVSAGNWREAIEQPIGHLPSPDPTIPNGAFALRVSGDSMDQYVEDGGTVIVDPTDRALFPGRFYVVLNDTGETTFKQFADNPARLAPCSTNPEHVEIMIGDGTAFSIVGRVIWRASRM
jgi:SOS-response transcriptional repressor LexA